MIQRIILIVFLTIPGLVFGETMVDTSGLQEILKTKIRAARHMALTPTVIAAVKAQNNQNISMTEIKALDDEWKKSNTMMPLKSAIQRNKAGQYMRRRIEGNPNFSEAFLTDNKGANVAMYPATSDYWQGDEDKWIRSYNDGNGVVYIGPVETDESTNTSAVQISAPVIERGQTIGVLVLGVKLDYVANKQ